MLRLPLVLIATLLCVSLNAQPYEVLEVSPSSGPSSGGYRVAIRINPVPSAPAPTLPSMEFGSVGVGGLFTSEGISVFAPPHPPGLVDFTIFCCPGGEVVVPRAFAYFRQSNPTPEFRVVSITPAFGPTSGGTEVTLQLDDVSSCFDQLPPAGMNFGGVEATNVRADFANNTITAVTAAHAAGTVEITVPTCGGGTETIEGGFTFTDAAPNPNPAYEKVLFPVLFFGPGARGSQWSTRISVYNAGQTLVDTPNLLFAGNPLCPAICGCQALSGVNPGETSTVCLAGFADPSGLLFYSPKSAEDDLHYHGRIFDESRSTVNAGTEIPVVREREFRTDEIVLLDIPLDGTPSQNENNFRVALRVYNPDQIDGAQVQMTVLDPGSTEVMGQQIITLSYPIVIVPDEFPNRPSFAFINDLQNVVREMIPAEVPVSRFHIRLTPVDPTTRIWAFASITNNETQLVTTITPQH